MLNKEDILALAWEHSEGSGKRYTFTEESLFEFLNELKKDQATSQAAARPVKLQHMSYAEDGALHWMSGRKIDHCELYAMPDFGRAPQLYAAPQPEQSGLVEPTFDMVQAACAAFRTDVPPMEAMTEALRAALSAQETNKI